MQTENKGLKKNLLYAFVAQGITLLVSVLMSLIVPKILGVEEFAYWQTFLLYAGYSGCLLLGINDGLYLRIGGRRSGELSREEIKAQLLFVVLLELFFSVILLGCSVVLDWDPAYRLISLALSAYAVVVNIANYLSYVFQAINLTQIFSKAAIINKTTFFVMLIAMLTLRIDDYRVIVLAYLLGQSISTVYLLANSREILVAPCSLRTLTTALSLTKIDISVGMKIMVGYYSGNFIIGFGRMLIEPNWDLVTFGYFSFAVSLVSFILSFAAQVAMVLFPHIKRANLEVKKNGYLKLRKTLSVFLPIAYVMFFPFCILCKYWLPQYSHSIPYLCLLYPICVFDCKMSMLCVPYLKALRKENMLLLANVVAMLVSVAFSLISVYSFHSLEYLALSMLAAIALRNLISELYLGELLNVDTLSRYAREVLLSICFLVVATLDSAPAYMGGLVVLTAYYGFELVLMLKERKGV